MSVMEKQVVEVQEKLEDITECPICTETFKDPKMLPCIHTFCMICLQEAGLKTSKSPGDRMPCPICRTDFTVPEIGFGGLQRNFFMERLIEMKNILKPSSTRVSCDACQEDNDLGTEAEIPSAAMYCADCSQRLCDECCKIHRKYKATKGHRMLSLDGSQINIPSIVKQYVCDKHESKPLEIYCSSCQEAICARCYFEGHKMHETSPVIDAVADFRRIIQEHADSMLKLFLDLKQKTAGKETDKVMFAAKVADVESEIKRIKQSLQECAEKDCDSLLLQLNCIKKNRMKGNENQVCEIEAVLASLESYRAYCAQVTAIGSDVDICRAVHILSTRAAELRKRYESAALEPLPAIWLKKTVFHDTLHQIGNNIIGKLEENGDNRTLLAESTKSFTDRISSLVNEFFGILDKTSAVDGRKDIRQTQDFQLDDAKQCKGVQKRKNKEKEMENNKAVEVLETDVSDEIKEWKVCDEKLIDKLKHLKIKIYNTVETNDRLKSELNFQQEHVLRIEKEIISMNHETKKKKMTEMRLYEEIVDLKKQVTLLSNIAYNGGINTQVQRDAQSKGRLIFLQTITTVQVVPEDKKFRVTGLAILDNELFIASASKVVEVNDLRTLKFKRRWHAEEMEKVVDMKASVHNKCIYLLCSSRPDHWTPEAYILRFSAKGKVIIKWKLPSVYIDDVQISVTDESNVLLTDGGARKLSEYSPDGELIRVISLKWESGIEHLTHAIKLTWYHFLICHGKDKDSLHRVCIVDIDGNVLKYYGEVGKSGINNPIYLEMAADDKILVADHLNQRLLLFNSSLEVIRPFYPSYNSPDDYSVTEKRPRKMILDEANGRLLVVESIWKAARKEECREQYGDQLVAFTFLMP